MHQHDVCCVGLIQDWKLEYSFYSNLHGPADIRGVSSTRDALITMSNTNFCYPTRDDVSGYNTRGPQRSIIWNVGASLSLFLGRVIFLLFWLHVSVVLASFTMFIRCNFLDRATKAWRCELPIHSIFYIHLKVCFLAQSQI